MENWSIGVHKTVLYYLFHEAICPDDGWGSPFKTLLEGGNLYSETTQKATDYWSALGKLVLELNLEDIMEIPNKSELLPLPGGIHSVLSHRGPHLLPVVWQECLGLSREYAQFYIRIWLEKYSSPQSMSSKVCSGGKKQSDALRLREKKSRYLINKNKLAQWYQL